MSIRTRKYQVRVFKAFLISVLVSAFLVSLFNYFSEPKEVNLIFYGMLFYLPFSLVLNLVLGLPVYFLYKKFLNRMTVWLPILFSGFLGAAIFAIVFQTADFVFLAAIGLVSLSSAFCFAHFAKLMPYNKLLKNGRLTAAL